MEKPATSFEAEKEEFKNHSKSASDAMRLIVSVLLFPTLALGFSDKCSQLSLNGLKLYALLLFLIYFLADLSQFLTRAIAIQLRITDSSLGSTIPIVLFYTKFIIGISGIILLTISIL
jgi:hypothetical protein